MIPTISETTSNTLKIILSPSYLKVIFWLIILLIISRIIYEIKYRIRYGHSSWFFERLFSFWKPVFNIRESFFTHSEKQFYKNLKEVLYKLFQYKYEIYPKTRLNDIFDTKYSKDWFMQSHTDFLIVDREQNFKPVLAIEVDWNSHNNRWQKKSDKFKDKVFNEAKLPLVRIKNEQSNDIKVAYAIIYKYLKSK